MEIGARLLSGLNSDEKNLDDYALMISFSIV